VAGVCYGPVFFCSVDYWAMRLIPNTSKIHVGGVVFSEFNYTDDIALLAPQHDELGQRLEDFATGIKTLGLSVSWPKTKLQNLRTGDCAMNIAVQDQQVEGVDHVCYLGSILHSSRHSFPDLLRRIRITSTSLNSMSRVWSRFKLSLATKLRHQTVL